MDAALLAGAGPVRSMRLVGGVNHLLREAARPRFRAASRARIRASVRASMWLAVLAMAIDIAWLLPGHEHAAARIVAANAAIGAIALASFWALGSFRRMSAELVMFGVLLTVDASIAMVIGIDLGISLLCAGYVLLLPPIVALLIPWSTRLHIIWLATHGFAAVLLSSLVPPEAQAIDGPRTLLALLVTASAGSLLGHLGNLRARVLSFTLIEQVRSMNRQARRDGLALRQLNMRLEQVAWTDQLTGLGNRLALQRQLGVARGRLERSGDRFALLMIDVDHFKVVNDVLGHFAGDDVLRRVALTLDETIRASDAAYRIGGEEFIAIIAIARRNEAALAAERLRGAVERLGIDHPGNPPFGVVTISVGACVIDARRLTEADDTWLQCADAALYEAKRRGRNRIVVATPNLAE